MALWNNRLLFPGRNGSVLGRILLFRKRRGFPAASVHRDFGHSLFYHDLFGSEHIVAFGRKTRKAIAELLPDKEVLSFYGCSDSSRLIRFQSRDKPIGFHDKSGSILLYGDDALHYLEQ